VRWIFFAVPVLAVMASLAAEVTSVKLVEI
jgi:hypothetical protein